jgi:hypothetical protein
LPAENKTKMKILDEGIIDKILSIFYETKNSEIFFLGSSILANFCIDYYFFSLKLINEKVINNIYNEIRNRYFNKPYIISNCLTCYKEALRHLYELLNSVELKKDTKDITYDCKRLLCNMVNWILYNKEIFT